MSDLLAAAAILAGLLGTAYCIRRGIRAWHGDDYRTHNDRRQAWLAACEGPRPEPADPGSDQQLLAQCLAICPELARKEDR